jgi:hypothetical protein
MHPPVKVKLPRGLRARAKAALIRNDTPDSFYHTKVDEHSMLFACVKEKNNIPAYTEIDF